MKNLFKGFDQLTPNEALKDKTINKILAQPAHSSRQFTTVKKVLAACIAVVVVGGGVFAAMMIGGISVGKKSSNMSLTADGGTAPEYGLSEDTNGTVDASPEAGGEVTDKAEATTDADGEPADGGGTTAKKDSATADTKAEAAGGAATDGAAAGAGTGAAPGSSSNQAAAGLLTAKAWNDNLNFNFWLNLMGQNAEFRQYQSFWGINLTKRIAVTVTNGQNALCRANVALQDAQGKAIWTAVTDNKGKAYLFFQVFQNGNLPKKIVVTCQGKTTEQVLEEKIAAEYTVTLNGAEKTNAALDLMFVCDTTGSMGDELSFLQKELADIIVRVKQQNGNIPLRLSVNFYRDQGDNYLLRSFPFVTDVNAAINNLKAQSADGGGDFEEAVEQALRDAIHKHEWSANASAKLLFLVLDAPPHDNAKLEMQKLMADAAKAGIRVIPVTASGINKNTEYLMRTLSISTGGTYVTLTNDSGIGGDHIEPTIGETKVYKLNDLLVNIIRDYLS